jgi:hypothetical protein
MTQHQELRPSSQKMEYGVITPRRLRWYRSWETATIQFSNWRKRQ